jgi:hypothetical protein
MNIRVLFFLLLSVLATSLDKKPLKQANYIEIIQHQYHTHHQIHNIVYDKQKQNKFDNFKTI